MFIAQKQTNSWMSFSTCVRKKNCQRDNILCWPNWLFKDDFISIFIRRCFIILQFVYHTVRVMCNILNLGSFDEGDNWWVGLKLWKVIYPLPHLYNKIELFPKWLIFRSPFLDFLVNLKSTHHRNFLTDGACQHHRSGCVGFVALWK